MRSRTFLNVSIGILALALAYHLGATTATAQAPGNPVVAAFGATANVVTAQGDVYKALNTDGPWHYAGNVFGTGTPVLQTSFGQLKARYRGERKSHDAAPGR